VGKLVGVVDDLSSGGPVEYNVHGYDMARRDRYVYAFVSADERRVKVGLVNSEGALIARRRRVEKDCNEPGLHETAHVRVPSIDGHEAEDVEAAIRLWLNRAHGFQHAGRVDWLNVPNEHDDWQRLLDDALEAVDAWRAQPPADS
jgi:hypothetical protein